MTYPINKNNNIYSGFTQLSNNIGKLLKNSRSSNDEKLCSRIVDYTQKFHEKVRRLTVPFLQSITGFSRRTLYRSIKNLKEIGVIEKYGDYVSLTEFYGKDKTKPKTLKKFEQAKSWKRYTETDKSSVENEVIFDKSSVENDENLGENLGDPVPHLALYLERHPYIKKDKKKTKKEKENGGTPQTPESSFSNKELVVETAKNKVNPAKPVRKKVKYTQEQYDEAEELMKLFVSLSMLSFSEDAFTKQVFVFVKLIIHSGFSADYIKNAMNWSGFKENVWYRTITSESGIRTYKQMSKLLKDYRPVYLGKNNRKWFNDTYKKGKLTYDGKRWINSRPNSVEITHLGRRLDDLIPFSSPTFIQEVSRWDARLKEIYDRGVAKEPKVSLQDDLLSRFLAAGGVFK